MARVITGCGAIGKEQTELAILQQIAAVAYCRS